MHEIKMYERPLAGGSLYPHALTGWALPVLLFLVVGPIIDGLTTGGLPVFIWAVFLLSVMSVNTVLHNTHAARHMNRSQYELYLSIGKLTKPQRQVVNLSAEQITKLNSRDLMSIKNGVEKMLELNSAEANRPAALAIEGINQYIEERNRDQQIYREVMDEINNGRFQL